MKKWRKAVKTEETEEKTKKQLWNKENWKPKDTHEKPWGNKETPRKTQEKSGANQCKKEIMKTRKPGKG